MANDETLSGLGAAFGGFATGFASGYTGQDFLSPYLKGLREKSRLNKRVQDQVSVLSSRLSRDPEAIDFFQQSFPGMSNEDIITLVGDYDSAAYSSIMAASQQDQLHRQKDAEVWADTRVKLLGSIPALKDSIPGRDEVPSAVEIQEYIGMLSSQELSNDRSTKHRTALEGRIKLAVARAESAQDATATKAEWDTFALQAWGEDGGSGWMGEAVGNLNSTDLQVLQETIQTASTEIQGKYTRRLNTETASAINRGNYENIENVDLNDVKVVEERLSEQNSMMPKLQNPYSQRAIMEGASPQALKDLVELINANKDVQSFQEFWPHIQENPALYGAIKTLSPEKIQLYEQEVANKDSKFRVALDADYLNTQFNLKEAVAFSEEDFVAQKDGSFRVSRAKTKEFLDSLPTEDLVSILNSGNWPDYFPQDMHGAAQQMYITKAGSVATELGGQEIVNLAKNRAVGNFERLLNPKPEDGLGQEFHKALGPLGNPAKIPSFDDPDSPLDKSFYEWYDNTAKRNEDMFYSSSQEAQKYREQLYNDVKSGGWLSAWGQGIPREFIDAVETLDESNRDAFIKRGALVRTPEELNNHILQSISPALTEQEVLAQRQTIAPQELLLAKLKSSGLQDDQTLEQIADLETHIDVRHAEIARLADLKNVQVRQGQIVEIARLLAGAEGGNTLDTEGIKNSLRALEGETLKIKGLEESFELDSGDLGKGLEFLADNDISLVDRLKRLAQLITISGIQPIGSTPTGDRKAANVILANSLTDLIKLAENQAYTQAFGMAAERGKEKSRWGTKWLYDDADAWERVAELRFGIPVDFESNFLGINLNPGDARLKLLLASLAIKAGV